MKSRKGWKKSWAIYQQNHQPSKRNRSPCEVSPQDILSCRSLLSRLRATTATYGILSCLVMIIKGARGMQKSRDGPPAAATPSSPNLSRSSRVLLPRADLYYFEAVTRPLAKNQSRNLDPSKNESYCPRLSTPDFS
jgi:hypothetical protein